MGILFCTAWTTWILAVVCECVQRIRKKYASSLEKSEILLGAVSTVCSVGLLITYWIAG
jgi:hypothetical protein